VNIPDSPQEVLALCAEIFPEEPVPDRARLLLEDMFADDASHQVPEHDS
jgi:hypothetical protein